jgi:hypothetical protein
MFVTATWTDLLALAEGDRLEELLEEGLIPDLPPEAWQGIVEDLKPHYSFVEGIAMRDREWWGDFLLFIGMLLVFLWLNSLFFLSR